VVQRVFVDVDFAVAVERAADFGFAGTFLNFIFSGSQSLEEFGRTQKQCLVGGAREMKRDRLQRKSCWDIHHHRNLAFLVLCLTTDSK